jgi:hypothetical protein
MFSDSFELQQEILYFSCQTNFPFIKYRIIDINAFVRVSKGGAGKGREQVHQLVYSSVNR